MAQLPALWQSDWMVEKTAADLAKTNHRLQGHGLALTNGEIMQLAQHHTKVLRQTARIEFGESVLPKLAFAFSDSPYIVPAEFAGALEELMELFYHFKNELAEKVSDDELVAFMKRHFDGECHGSIEYLSGTVLEALAEDIRFGRAQNAIEPDEEELDVRE